jgi:hypothetical protein
LLYRSISFAPNDFICSFCFGISVLAIDPNTLPPEYMQMTIDNLLRKNARDYVGAKQELQQDDRAGLNLSSFILDKKVYFN